MTHYRLKPDARHFFQDKFSTEVEDLDYWKLNYIPIELLDEVSDVHIVYGHSHTLSSGCQCADLKGYDYGKKLGSFHFTIKVERMTEDEYKNADVHLLMDKIQKVIDKHFKDRKS